MVVVRAKRRCPAAMSALAEEGAGGGNGECHGRRGDSGGGEREDADAASEAGSEAAAAAAATMREDSVEEQGGHGGTPMLFPPLKMVRNEAGASNGHSWWRLLTKSRHVDITLTCLIIQRYFYRVLLITVSQKVLERCP